MSKEKQAAQKYLEDLSVIHESHYGFGENHMSLSELLVDYTKHVLSSSLPTDEEKPKSTVIEALKKAHTEGFYDCKRMHGLRSNFKPDEYVTNLNMEQIYKSIKPPMSDEEFAGKLKEGNDKLESELNLRDKLTGKGE